MRERPSAWFSLASCAEKIQILAIFYARRHLLKHQSCFSRRGNSIFSQNICANAILTGSLLTPAQRNFRFWRFSMRSGTLYRLTSLSWRCHQPLPLSSTLAAVISLCRCHQPSALPSTIAAAISPLRCHQPSALPSTLGAVIYPVLRFFYAHT